MTELPWLHIYIYTFIDFFHILLNQCMGDSRKIDETLHLFLSCNLNKTGFILTATLVATTYNGYPIPDFTAIKEVYIFH